MKEKFDLIRQTVLDIEKETIKELNEGLRLQLNSRINEVFKTVYKLQTFVKSHNK